jgi:hypothetical protein
MNKKSIVKRLQNKAERLWKEYCLLRDGGCMIQNYYPCHCLGGSILQVHHIFSRTNKRIFFDCDNGIVLCRDCHLRVTFSDSYKELVRRIAEQKDKEVYYRLWEQSMIKGSYLEFKNIEWLEEQIKILEEMIAYAKKEVK